MATYTVVPREDGYSIQESWKVKTPTGTEKPATTKQAAENKARQMANEGDTIRLHRVNGQFQESYTYRGSRDSSEDQQQSGQLPGMGTFKTGIVDGFNYD